MPSKSIKLGYGIKFFVGRDKIISYVDGKPLVFDSEEEAANHARIWNGEGAEVVQLYNENGIIYEI